MTLFKWGLIVLLTAVALALVAGQMGWLRGTAPIDLGVRDGRLKPPSMSPNSVSSQAALTPDHPMRGRAEIAPLALRGDGPATMAKLKTIVERTPGATLVTVEPDYLYAQFSTRLLKFVDDVEFWFDPVGRVIQVRSASRLGESDLGANRARIEAIRTQLASD